MVESEMTKPGVIYQEKPQQCDLCGKMAELRPYGPNGEKVCFDCGMRDEEAAKAQFHKYMEGGTWVH
jgi:hypothetical protein